MILLSKVGLIAAYVLIALLLLSANLYANWSWRVKAIVIFIVSCFYIITYYSFPPLFGWPTADKLPERFHLVSAYVLEPDKRSGAAGEIYLWVTDLTAGSSRRTPRAHRLEFSEELHSRVVEASTKLRKGLPQLGEVKKEEEVVGPRARPSDETRAGQLSTNITFFDLPDPLFPDK